MTRRPVEWAGRAFSVQTMPKVAGTESDLVIVDADEAGPNNFSFEHYTRPTIVRIVGSLIVQLNQAGTGVDNYSFRYLLGLMCADEDKGPGRLDEELGHSWLWMGVGHLHRPQFVNRIPDNAGGSLQVNTNDYGAPTRTHVLNIKSMRKVPRDCELRLVMHCMTVNGDIDPHVTGFVRCLIKE